MKFAILIGETPKGERIVLDGPTEDVDSLVKQIEALTNNGGKAGSGKDAIEIENAVVLHSRKGVIKRRKGLVAGAAVAEQKAKEAKAKAKAKAKAE